MKTNRRKFFKIAGVAGAGVLSGGITSCNSPETTKSEMPLASIKEAAEKTHQQQFNMCGYAAPKLDKVRIGFIGLGNRGPGAVERMSNIEGVEIVALCDKDVSQIAKGQKILAKHGFEPAKEYGGTEDIWKEMCQNPDIDLVYICTPWKLHTPMAVFAMENDKHAATEVPAAVTVEQAWQLVETSERTKKHCMMLENCCYDFFELLTLNMARQGFFGEVLHVEGAYNHNLLNSNFRENGYSDMWRLKENQTRNGNLYPTHGLGPVCQVLNINRGDRMDYLTSMSTNDFQMANQAKELAAENEFFKEFETKNYRGNMNSTLVRTINGKSIMIQHDVTSNRPYSRIHLVSGTDGIAQKWPLPGKIAKGHGWFDADELKVLEEQYTPKIVNLVGDMAKKVGGHGGMDFLMDWRLIDCLRNGIALDQDVYDAALWSVIAPLSEWSVANRSNSIEVPDFTNGAWKTNTPVDVELSKGGTTGVRITAEAESQLDV
ncbi:MAG: Gfo/Idh/MocA family oxidoreductase [Prolixibacteraceae bacterium]|jgi:predicted dehydrogenase|nr:Gfo/Idh/MocA family oxidoreductase [Prolixibacteraceae bacterium]MBT7000609.1 Gfo/Idh/MocA family oxidoreductase [Prolixibacteraceae bacterium]MBT7395541.1 Gfo/Idh/MocA family oxidoreductase [Prolixibacteraceae bacterium]